MKKLLLVFGLLSVVNTAVFSQEKDRKFTIQTNSFLYIIDLVSLGQRDDTSSFFIMDLEGQYKINEAINVSLTVSFLVNNRNYTGYHSVYYSTDYFGNPMYHTEKFSYDTKEFQINFKPMFIYRPFKTGIEGFYIGAYPHIGWHTLKNKDIDDSLLAEIGKSKNYLWTEIGIGIETGYKWVFRKGFTLQLGGRIGKTWSIPKKPDNMFGDPVGNSDGRITLKNFDLYLAGFKLGYSF